MLSKFQSIIRSNFPNPERMTFLLAVSGGCDSMVLLDLFARTNYKVKILHCNYGLRDNAWKETIIVSETCRNNNTDLAIVYFPTPFLNKRGRSTQELCRDLRYEWFSKMTVGCSNPVIVTAHHADDNIETFMINLNRGSGLKGLTGMSILSENLFRPLLPFNRKDIMLYSEQNNLKYRDDESNFDDDYLRNYFRLEVIPKIEQRLPNFGLSMAESMSFLREADQYISEHLAVFKNKYETVKGDITYLSDREKWHPFLLKMYLIDKGFGKKKLKQIFRDLLSPGGSFQDSRYKVVATKNGIAIGPLQAEVIDVLIEDFGNHFCR
jgi:tRNA(Ile)-lysidine synthase